MTLPSPCVIYSLPPLYHPCFHFPSCWPPFLCVCFCFPFQSSHILLSPSLDLFLHLTAPFCSPGPGFWGYPRTRGYSKGPELEMREYVWHLFFWVCVSSLGVSFSRSIHLPGNYISLQLNKIPLYMCTTFLLSSYQLGDI